MLLAFTAAVKRFAVHTQHNTHNNTKCYAYLPYKEKEMKSAIFWRVQNKCYCTIGFVVVVMV